MAPRRFAAARPLLICRLSCVGAASGTKCAYISTSRMLISTTGLPLRARCGCHILCTRPGELDATGSTQRAAARTFEDSSLATKAPRNACSSHQHVQATDRSSCVTNDEPCRVRVQALVNRRRMAGQQRLVYDSMYTPGEGVSSLGRGQQQPPSLGGRTPLREPFAGPSPRNPTPK